MAALRQRKPRPLAKLYGRMGPTPEQRTAWEETTRRWNRLYRCASQWQKHRLAEENEAWRTAPTDARPMQYGRA